MDSVGVVRRGSYLRRSPTRSAGAPHVGGCGPSLFVSPMISRMEKVARRVDGVGPLSHRRNWGRWHEHEGEKWPRENDWWNRLPVQATAAQAGRVPPLRKARAGAHVHQTQAVIPAIPADRPSSKKKNLTKKLAVELGKGTPVRPVSSPCMQSDSLLRRHSPGWTQRLWSLLSKDASLSFSVSLCL